VSTFFDTNVLVYAFDRTEGVKHARAEALLVQHVQQRSIVISTQVLQETFSVLTRKKHFDPADVLETLEVFRRERVVPANTDSVLRGLALSHQHRLSVGDALIVQAAIDARCTVLLTEDLQSGMRFGELEVLDPFLLSVHEPIPAYGSAPKREKRSRRKPA
jgi:predicted nucleic acid-binding protein